MGVTLTDILLFGKAQSDDVDNASFVIYRRNILRWAAIGGALDVIVGPAQSPLSLPDAIANSLDYVKAYGGTKQTNIPDIYTQVNYVTNTAQTAVNTGIMVDFAKNYEFEVECGAVAGSWYILQSRETTTSNITGISGSNSGSTITLVVGNVTACTSAITRVFGNKLYVKATLNNGVATLYVKDETAGIEDTQTGSYGTTQPNPPTPVYLLGNAGGNYVQVNSDIYMARIKENGVTIMDYVPARQGATAGFYDKVSGTFKTAVTPANLSADGDTVPTPDAPMNIVCNNGVLKPNTSATGYSTQTGTPTPTNPIDIVSYKQGDLILRGIGEYKDTYDATTGTITRNVGVKVLDGTENWNQYSVTQGTLFRTQIADAVSGAKDALGVLCNAYQVVASGLRENGTLTGSATNYDFINDDYTTSDDWKEYLADQYTAGTPVIIVYPLATPTTEHYVGAYADGATETLHAGSANIFELNNDVFLQGIRYSVTRSGNDIVCTALSSTTSASRFNIFMPTSWFKPNTTYYFSTKASASFSGARCNIGKATPGDTTGNAYYGNITTKTNNGFAGSFTITDIAPDQGYVSFFYYLDEQEEGVVITISDIMITQGATAPTDYTPYYDGGTATCESLLSVGNNTDVQEVLSGDVTRKVGIKVFDGTEDVYLYNGGSGFYYNIPDTLPQSGGYGFCTHAPRTLSVNSFGVRWGSGSNTYMYFCQFWSALNISTTAEFKQWLAAQYAAGTPVIIVYPLATETTETVVGQALNVTNGDNVVDITQASLGNLELEAKYKAAVSLTIQEVQDANLDPNVEVTIN